MRSKSSRARVQIVDSRWRNQTIGTEIAINCFLIFILVLLAHFNPLTMLSLKFLAVLLGTFIVATRLPGVFYPKPFIKVCKGYLKDEKFLRAAALMPLGFAVAILMQKYDFTQDWETVMSVFGWLMLLASLYMLWEPKVLEKRALKVLKNREAVQGLCVVGVAIGIALIYLGLVVY